VFWTITSNSVKPSPFPFNQEFYLVMNLAIGGWFVGNIVDPDLQSAKMNIDWIRYYSVNGVGKVIKH
jgi:beta-glucanase (GH16 family)